MAGVPTPCPFEFTPPPDATTFTLTWFRVWPITYDENAAVSLLALTIQGVHSAGGQIIYITFYDVNGDPLPTDRCGNPVVAPALPAPHTLNPPPNICPDGYNFDPESGTCIPIGVVIIPPGTGGGGGSGGG